MKAPIDSLVYAPTHSLLPGTNPSGRTTPSRMLCARGEGKVPKP